MTGLFVSMVEMVLLALVPDKTSAIGVMCLGSAGNVVFPSIASIKSNNVAASEQVIFACACCMRCSCF